MSIEACAAVVERGDPLRFRAAMAAPVTARRVLFPLYALNVEVARAPWVTAEAMLAEMRLQWWRDVLAEVAAGGPVRRHEVTDALAQVLDAEGALALDALVEVRRWDVYRDGFADRAHFDRYIDGTSGALMGTAARLLGPADAQVVADFAHGVGVAAFLRAIPALEAAGRRPLVDGTASGVRDLADGALARLDAARRRHRDVSPAAGAALLAGWPARAVLQAAVRDPGLVAVGGLEPAPLADQLRLMRAAGLGWWR
ncbi:Phytoene/squalene synthetase [Loktanella fryxellensis]|uniref:Phytoene/squalene synthetase n=1 Tax=Loktanella fryxellensis TaxID=245187 RepID=A0A1H7YGJ9_9RHOB|nr:squalene/phytoene synthase family protein [Loktanella fryxellensis]SEM45021.1 Phytoene/squalene synthetase [Loktanella fryxellensis]